MFNLLGAGVEFGVCKFDLYVLAAEVLLLNLMCSMAIFLYDQGSVHLFF